MLNEKIQEAFNKQINAELYSSYLYLAMATYFASVNLNGMANWMKCQVQEEIMHAMKFYDFILERGGKVTLPAIDAPTATWDSPLAAFEAAYGHEQKVTGMINALVDLAILEKDHAANAFLQWFVTEQVEEESTADGIVQQLKLAGDRGGALFMIDRELGSRVFTPPANKKD